MAFQMEPPETRVKDCITFTERPSTPPEIRLYRKSAYIEPGKRFVHHGLVADLEKMDLGNKIYGQQSDSADATAAELLTHKKPTELERIALIKAEKVYKGAAREPLGKSVNRYESCPLPEKFTKGNKAFGIGSKSSLEPAKDIIFPKVERDTTEEEKVYQVSHGTYGAGEQKNRNYKWPASCSPLVTVFGDKGDQIALNGVSNNIAVVLNPPENNQHIVNAKRVEDFKNSHDTIGRSKNLGQDSALRPFDLCYGMPSKKAGQNSKIQSSAFELIRGKYKPEEQMPDPDLGRSQTPGFRNISMVDRAFGVPSIRTDLPARPISSRSVADSQNYGDDVPAQDLINPPAFNELSISHDVMNKVVKKDKLLQTFRNIGYKTDGAVEEIIFIYANKTNQFPSGYCTCNAYRDVLNDYLDAVECGNALVWLHKHRSDM